MTITVTTNARTRRVLLSVSNLGRATKEAISEGFERMGSGLVRTLQNSVLNEPKFGREYVLSGAKGVQRLSRPSKNRAANYQASAPGQTPGFITGQYSDKAFYKPHGVNGLEFGDSVPYAEFLELGTEKMEPRPGLGNAIESDLRNSRLYLEESLDSGIRP